MSNLLGVPSPRTAPVALRAPVQAHLRDTFPDMEASLFDRDIDAWTSAREACLSHCGHSQDVSVWLRYAAQLAFLERVLGTWCGASFPWVDGFSTGDPVPYARLDVERAYVLLHLATQYAQLGAAEWRSEADGVKRAANYFQWAAGCLALVETCPDTPPAAQAPCLKQLMLAQAQECVWQKAVHDGLLSTTIAKLARSTADLYAASAYAAPAAGLPPGWTVHIECKRWHFAAAAEYRKSCDDLAHRRYADELGRLRVASDALKRARALPTRLLPQPAVLQDLVSLEQVLATNLSRATKDNDLIYLQAPTGAAALPDMGAVLMVRDVCPSELQAPVAFLKRLATSGTPLLFGRLVTYGVDVAVRVYNDRRQQWLLGTLEPLARELDASLAHELAATHIAATLERLEAPAQIPSAWGTYAAAVQRAPVAALEQRLRATEDLACRCRALLSELEQQPGQDMAMMREYERTLAQSAESDGRVRAQLRANASRLRTWEQGRHALREALTPSALAVRDAHAQLASEVRAIRAQKEQLDDMVAQRRTIILRAHAMMERDEIRQRLMDVVRARRLGELDESLDTGVVDPAALQDVLEHALEPYDVFLQEMHKSGGVQRERLGQLRRAHARLLREPRIARALDAQADASHALEDAFHAWEALQSHVNEGAMFYERLARMLQQLQRDAA
ncbi:pH-response regulator protein palA/rim20 [Malassezia caprae]|uniref:PH-response regulator protein palA/rim20 n=1 Tax=Malassezia caprae TaxID=1381934 RepID=A0AAF0E7T7_9BASI|nr:pH-response regulator protein palA/rim20 [Malassezia caprae]